MALKASGMVGGTMEQDRIWTTTHSGPRSGATSPATSGDGAATVEAAETAHVARLTGERDSALAQVEHLRRAIETQRRTIEEARAAADAEIERLRRALAITREAAENEREVARRERRELIAHLDAQQEARKRSRPPLRAALARLFRGKSARRQALTVGA